MDTPITKKCRKTKLATNCKVAALIARYLKYPLKSSLIASLTVTDVSYLIGCSNSQFRGWLVAVTTRGRNGAH